MKDNSLYIYNSEKQLKNFWQNVIPNNCKVEIRSGIPVKASTPSTNLYFEVNPINLQNLRGVRFTDVFTAYGVDLSEEQICEIDSLCL